jgi:hypothetical protein
MVNMSNPALSDVRARRSVIKAERETIRARDQVLVTEDQELEVAERALLRLAGVTEVQKLADLWQAPHHPAVHPDDGLGSWSSSAGWVTPNIARPNNGTHEDYTAWLLAGSVDPWATANQIQAALSQMVQRPIPLTSVSPMLTSMKNKGIIARDGLKVALASRVPTNRAAAE